VEFVKRVLSTLFNLSEKNCRRMHGRFITHREGDGNVRLRAIREIRLVHVLISPKGKETGRELRSNLLLVIVVAL
jgi:hypothetical protein